jgi:hypothetical protein
MTTAENAQKILSGDIEAHNQQGCQIFLGTKYQSGEKIYQMTPKLLNARKIHPMDVKYSK